MSLDWHWVGTLALVVPPAVGHVSHLVVLVNTVSGLGYAEAILDRVRAVLFAAFWTSAAYLFWAHLHEPWCRWTGPLYWYAVLCTFSGLVVMPLCSLRLALRPRPEGISGRSQSLDLATREGKQALLGHARHSWILRLPGNESFRLVLRDWDLVIPDLPASLVGLRIVQVSDLHFSPCYARHFFECVADACGEWNADLLFVTGDVVEDDETIAWIGPVLGRLEGRLGKFAVLGNHDAEHEVEAIMAELKRAGFTTLHGQWTTFVAEGVSVAIGGTSAPWGPAWTHDEVPTADFRILLSHSPDLFYKAQRWHIELMFSGHNHGGQIRLPGIGAVFVPSRYSRRFDRGFFRGGRTLMYVSQGIGGKHPYRVGCPPEVCRFTLHSSEP